MNRRQSIQLFAGSSLAACLSARPCSAATAGNSPAIRSLFQAVDRANILQHPDWFIWGGSACRDSAGLYHLLYARWPKNTHFAGWVTHSKIARATCELLRRDPHPDAARPQQDRPRDLRVPPRPLRPPGHHPARPRRRPLGRPLHPQPARPRVRGQVPPLLHGQPWRPAGIRETQLAPPQHQRIGVGVASHPAGPWQRRDTPLIDVSPEADAADALCIANPSVTRMPDGRYLMIYKAVARKKPLPFGGPVSHRAAIAASPTGPFIKQPGLVFHSKTDDFPAEDPFIWHDGTRFRAIAKDMHGVFSGVGTALVEFESADGLDWKPADPVLVTTPEIRWRGDDKPTKVAKLERPHLFVEDGRPTTLFVAVGSRDGSSFNLPIPLGKA